MRQFQTSTELAYYEQRVELDGSTFVFRFRWNARFGYWSVDIFDSDEAPIALARKILINVDLVRQFHHLASPEGLIVAFDSLETDVKPGLIDLGDRVLLLYVEAAELAAL